MASPPAVKSTIKFNRFLSQLRQSCTSINAGPLQNSVIANEFLLRLKGRKGRYLKNKKVYPVKLGLLFPEGLFVIHSAQIAYRLHDTLPGTLRLYELVCYQIWLLYCRLHYEYASWSTLVAVGLRRTWRFVRNMFLESVNTCEILLLQRCARTVVITPSMISFRNVL